MSSTLSQDVKLESDPISPIPGSVAQDASTIGNNQVYETKFAASTSSDFSKIAESKSHQAKIGSDCNAVSSVRMKIDSDQNFEEATDSVDEEGLRRRNREHSLVEPTESTSSTTKISKLEVQSEIHESPLTFGNQVNAATLDFAALSAIYSHLGKAYFCLQEHTKDPTQVEANKSRFKNALENSRRQLELCQDDDELLNSLSRHLQICQEHGDRIGIGFSNKDEANVCHAQDTGDCSTPKADLKTTSEEGKVAQESFFNDRTPELVLKIASYLNIKDLISFSSTCQNVYHICESDNKLWSNALQMKNCEQAQEFIKYAETIIAEQTYFQTAKVNKLAALLYNETKHNWTTGKFQNIRVELGSFYNHFNIKSYSNFYLPTSFTCKDDSDGTKIIQFGLWDVRKRKFAATFSERIVSIFVASFYIYDDFFIVEFFRPDDQMLVARYNIEIEEKAVKVFETVVVGKYMETRTFPNIFVCVFENPDHESEMLIFSSIDGSRLSSCKSVCTSKSKLKLLSSEDWIVVSNSTKLFAFNYKTDTTRILREKHERCSHIIMKSKKVLCCWENDIELIDVESGNVIWSSNLLGIDDIDDILKCDFDRLSNEVEIWQIDSGKTLTRTTFKGSSPQTVEIFPVCDKFSPVKCLHMFGSVVFVSYNNKSVTFLQVANQNGSWSRKFASQPGFFLVGVRATGFTLIFQYKNGKNQNYYQVLKFNDVKNSLVGTPDRPMLHSSKSSSQ